MNNWALGPSTRGPWARVYHGWVPLGRTSCTHYLDDMVSRLKKETFRRSHAQIEWKQKLVVHLCTMIIGDTSRISLKLTCGRTAIMQDEHSNLFERFACNTPQKPTFNISRQAFVYRGKGDTVSAPRCIKFCNYSRRGVDQDRRHTFRI